MSTLFATEVSPHQLAAFCAQIEMPEEVTELLRSLWRHDTLEEYQNQVQGLRDVKTASNTVERMAQSSGGKDGWKIVLSAHLCAALLNKPTLYDAAGIPLPVFVETMKCFSRFVREHYQSFGRYGFDRAFWTWRQINGRLFRLGALEFEMISQSSISPASPPLATKSAPALSIHIPSDAVLSDTALEGSYRKARAFFFAHFPAYEKVAFYCSTWLLSPKLQSLLPASSGILRFARDYEICLNEPDSDAAMAWLFPQGYENPQDLPESTSLQRAAKALYLRGGHIGSAAGFIAADD